MRKIFVILSLLCACVFTSCSTSAVVNSVGNITAFSASGDTVKQWKNVLLASQSYGSYNDVWNANGITFLDKTTGQSVFINNAVPVIIEFTSEVVDAKSNLIDTKINITETTDLSKYSVEELLGIQRIVQNDYYAKRKLIKKADKNSPEYTQLNEEAETLKNQFNILKKKLGNFSLIL